MTVTRDVTNDDVLLHNHLFRSFLLAHALRMTS